MWTSSRRQSGRTRSGEALDLFVELKLEVVCIPCKYPHLAAVLPLPCPSTLSLTLSVCSPLRLTSHGTPFDLEHLPF